MANQVESDPGTCVIYLLWSLPNNIAPDDISHFAIYINGMHVANETRNVNESLTMTVYRLCSCGPHSIGVSAVNRCGRSGRNLLITTERQPPIHQLTMECLDNFDSTSTATTGRNQYQSMCIDIVPVNTHTHTRICMIVQA